MEPQWSLVAVLLLAVQARANPWLFGEDHPNFRNIYQVHGQIAPFTYNTRQILTIPPCMTLKYVWVKVSNTLGNTPSVKLHKSINVVSITYGLLQYTGSDYSILARGFRTPNCNPGVHQNDNSFIPYRLKGENSNNLRTKAQKLKKNILQRKGQDRKEALHNVDQKNSADDDDDLKDKKYRYDNDSEDKYDSIKDNYEDMTNKLKEVGSKEKQNYMIFIITGNKASQNATGDNGGDEDVGHDRGSVKGNDGDYHGLDYGKSKDYSHKGSKFIGIDEYSEVKGHAKTSGYDRGRGNGKGVSYRGTDGNKHTKKEEYSDGSGFNSDDRNSMTNVYGGSNRHVKDKTSLGYGKGYVGSSNDENERGGSSNKVSVSNRHNNKNSIGYVKAKGYGGSSNDENDQDDFYDEDEERYRHAKNKNSVVNKGSNNEENYKRGLYDGDIRYFGSNGHANYKEYDGSSRLDDDYLDGFGIGNKNQPNGRGKDITMFCSDYLRTNNGRESKNTGVDKKVYDYCLYQVERSNT